MAFRLLDRNRPIPNGETVRDACTNYKAPQFATFTQQWQGVQQARLGNPGLAKRYNLPTDDESCQNFVDGYLAKICADRGYVGFFTTGGSLDAAPPFPKHQSPERSLARVAAGAEILIDWIKSGAEAVPQELSNQRAACCAKCPLNDSGDWTKFFTVPVSAAIRKALQSRDGMKLSTPDDDKIHVCSACLCPLKLKIHIPIDRILSKLDNETRGDLDTNCWIVAEAK